MSYYLFLDDVRNPIDVSYYYIPTKDRKIFMNDNKWITARNYDEFVSIIKERGIPEIVSFDHDLADEHYALVEGENEEFKEKTGLDCAKFFLEEYNKNKPDFDVYVLVHSQNPIGKERIQNLFKDGN